MNDPIVGAAPAALAAPFLLLVPGLVLLALLPRREREAQPCEEALFLAVALSVATSAWLGLLLAELGLFSLAGAGALLAAGSGVALLLGRRRLGVPWRRPVRLAGLVPVALVLALALALQARPSEYLVGGRDPGAYIAAMGVIGRSGGIVYTDPAVRSIPAQDRELFYRHPEKPPFSWARFLGFDLESPHSGRVYPQFFHLFPAFGAYLFQAMGVKGALATPPLIGVLATLAVFFALRRVLGPGPALLAATLLALNAVQVWFARYPASETLTQLLIFLGLLAVSRWEARGSPVFAAIAGAAFGLTLLVRIDSALIVAPLGAYLLIRRVQGRLSWSRSAPLLGAFCAVAGHALLHALMFARKYALDVVDRPYWRQPAPVWIAAGALALAAMALAPRLGAWIAAQPGSGARLRAVAALGLVTLGLYAYFLRPELSAWAGGDGNDPSRRLGGDALHWLALLGFRRLAAHDAQALVRLGWFVTPPALALGLAGLVLLLRRWRPRYLLTVLTGVAFALFYLYKIRVFNDYYFALRRYVPAVLPCLFAFAAYALWRGLRRGGRWRAAAAAAALVLAIGYARDSARLYSHVDWRGAVRFVEGVARHFGPEDVVVFEQTASIHLLSLPLWAVHGVNVLELARFNPDPARLDHLIRSWRDRYRSIYFVYTYRSDLCSLFLQRVQPFEFSTWEWERSYAAPPRGRVPQALRFTVARVVLPQQLQVPPLEQVDVGGTDDALVSAGFFDKEGGGERTFRWTGRCASVYLPGATPGGLLSVVASAGPERPAANPARVTASLSGVRLGEFVAGSGFAAHALELPDPLPEGPPVLRLDVPDWRPIDALPGSRDTRDLGIMVERIRLGSAAEQRAPAR